MTCQYSGCNAFEGECSGECIQSYKNAMVDAEMASQKAMSKQIEIMNELIDAKSKIAELREDNERLTKAQDQSLIEYANRLDMYGRQLQEANALAEKYRLESMERKAQLAALQAGGEAYAYEIPLSSGNGSELVYAGWFKQQGEEPYGTPLYAHPQPAAPIAAIPPGYAETFQELARWLHAAYDRPPITPEARRMLALADALASAPAIQPQASPNTQEKGE